MSGTLKGKVGGLLKDLVGFPIQRKTDPYVYFLLRTGFDNSIPDSDGNCSPARAKRTLELNGLPIVRFKHDEDSLAIKIERREKERAEILFDQMKIVVTKLVTRKINQDDFVNFGSLNMVHKVSEVGTQKESETPGTIKEVHGQATEVAMDNQPVPVLPKRSEEEMARREEIREELTNTEVCFAVWGRVGPGKKWTLEEIHDLLRQRLPQLKIRVVESPQIINNIVRLTIRKSDEKILRAYMDSPKFRNVGYCVSSI